MNIMIWIHTETVFRCHKSMVFMNPCQKSWSWPFLCKKYFKSQLKNIVQKYCKKLHHNSDKFSLKFCWFHRAVIAWAVLWILVCIKCLLAQSCPARCRAVSNCLALLLLPHSVLATRAMAPTSQSNLIASAECHHSGHLNRLNSSSSVQWLQSVHTSYSAPYL